MFEKLIKQHLPATVKQLYKIAQEQQPEDWGGPVCPHRRETQPDDLECMHQLRRELFKLADHTGGRNGIWHLKKSK